MSVEYAKIFLQAADAIRDRGHARYFLEDDNGCVCLLGAIQLVINGDPLRSSKEATIVVDSLRPLMPADYSPVAWNNMEGRTGDEVINLLRKAAGVDD